MLGAIFSLAFAASMSVNSIVVRKGVMRVSVNYITTLSVLSGPIFFFLLALLAGEVFQIASFNWKVNLFFAIAGIIHFALGRTFGYRSTQLLGANRSTTIVGMYAVVSVILAIIVLGEKLTPFTITGAILSTMGPLIIVFKEGQSSRSAEAKINPNVNSLDKKTLYLGVLFGLGAAVLWGSSPIFIKLAMDNGGTAIAGNFISYSAASVIVCFSLFNKKDRQEILRRDWPSLKIAIMSSLAANIAQLARYLALNYGSVIVVSIVSRTIPVWTIALSYIFNRKLESFSRWVFLGNGLLILGTILVML